MVIQTRIKRAPDL